MWTLLHLGDLLPARWPTFREFVVDHLFTHRYLVMRALFVFCLAWVPTFIFVGIHLDRFAASGYPLPRRWYPGATADELLDGAPSATPSVTVSDASGNGAGKFGTVVTVFWVRWLYDVLFCFGMIGSSIASAVLLRHVCGTKRWPAPAFLVPLTVVVCVHACSQWTFGIVASVQLNLGLTAFTFLTTLTTMVVKRDPRMWIFFALMFGWLMAFTAYMLADSFLTSHFAL